MPPFQPHLEVWLLIAGLIWFGWYTAQRIQPNAIAAGGRPITRAQKRWFVIGVAVLWFASDWPVHDVAEERLYFVHMFQHLMMTFIVPPILLLATPEWLARFLLGEGRLRRTFYRFARPVPAAIVFNVAVAISHWAWIVNQSVRIGPLHYSLHALLFVLAVLVWTPVCGPLPELRLTPPGKMVHLFLLSIIPTIPAAWLTVSGGVLYSVYDHDPRLWGIDVVYDQQLAGVVMKLIGGFYLWSIIIVMFFRWSSSERTPGKKYRGTLVESGATSRG